MRNRERRLKASDISPTVYPFEQEFPQVVDFMIKVQEKRACNYCGKVRNHTFTPAHPPQECVNCSNPYCFDGGFSIRDILRDMVDKRETERQTSETCRGYWGSPQGQRKAKPCFNFFDVSIVLKYRDDVVIVKSQPSPSHYAETGKII